MHCKMLMLLFLDFSGCLTLLYSKALRQEKKPKCDKPCGDVGLPRDDSSMLSGLFVIISGLVLAGVAGSIKDWSFASS